MPVTVAHPYLADPPPRAFAHRGWHLGELAGMENSLPAFRQAATEGYRYIETDVHATADGVVVVHHDAWLDRTTDRTGPIAQQKWQTVRRANIGGKTPVIRLEEALEELPDTFFNVDIKAPEAVEPFVRVIQRCQAVNRVAAASFSEARLAHARKLAGRDLATALGPASAGILWAHGWFPFLRLGSLSRGILAQVPVRQGPMRIVTNTFLRSARHLGTEVHTWTINDPAQMAALLDLGVHGIVTDRPDLLRAVLVQRGHWHSHREVAPSPTPPHPPGR